MEIELWISGAMSGASLSNLSNYSDVGVGVGLILRLSLRFRLVGIIGWCIQVSRSSSSSSRSIVTIDWRGIGTHTRSDRFFTSPGVNSAKMNFLWNGRYLDCCSISTDLVASRSLGCASTCMAFVRFLFIWQCCVRGDLSCG